MAAARVAKPSEQTPRKRPEKRNKKFDFERNARTIFVGNLPTNLDQKDVAKMFKDCGPVESARIRSVVAEKEKLPPKVAQITKRIHPKVDSVNAYVVFKSNENDECIKNSLAMNGKLIEGHHIRVDRAGRPKAKRETLTSRKKSIFVGNLRFDLRDDDLINHFNKVGSVNYVRLVRDRSTGLGKGFGFVVFNDRVSVKKALELDDTDFKGRKIRIKKVEEEEEKKKKKQQKKSKENPGEASQQGEEDSEGGEVEMDHDDDEDDQDEDDIEEKIEDEDDEPEEEEEEEEEENDDDNVKEEDNDDQNGDKSQAIPKVDKKSKLNVKLNNKKKNRSNFNKKVKRTKGKKKFGRRGKK